MTRLELREELYFLIGLAIGPLQAAYDDGVTSPQRIAVLRARFESDQPNFVRKATEFCTVGSHVFRTELGWIVKEFTDLIHFVAAFEHEPNRSQAPHFLANQLGKLRERINRVPVELPSDILGATPFQSYLLIRTLVSSALTRVEIFDPFLGQEVFDRYLPPIAPGVLVTLVTDTRILRDTKRRDRILAVSSLYAMERGTAYRILTANQFHDRHLRVDDQVFHLGGSLKDAGKNAPFTITQVMESAAGTALDRLRDDASPYVG